MQTERLLTVKQVSDMIGFGKTFIWDRSADGRFPKPVKVTAKATRWKQSEVQQWINDLQKKVG